MTVWVKCAHLRNELGDVKRLLTLSPADKGYELASSDVMDEEELTHLYGRVESFTAAFLQDKEVDGPIFDLGEYFNSYVRS